MPRPGTSKGGCARRTYEYDLGLILRENLVPNVSRRSRAGLLEVDFLDLWYQLFIIGGDEERGGGRSWILRQHICPTSDLVNLFLHEFSFDDSVLSAEMETEVESTSAISSEVQPHSQNLANELVWPEKSFGVDIWDP